VVDKYGRGSSRLDVMLLDIDSGSDDCGVSTPHVSYLALSGAYLSQRVGDTAKPNTTNSDHGAAFHHRQLSLSSGVATSVAGL